MRSKAPDAQPVSAFKRDSAKIAARLKRSGKPIVLTVNGKATMVVQDAVAYQKLLDRAALADAAEMRAFLTESRADIDAGRTLPAKEFLESLGKLS
jgi:PHD/YefM family antitoxin component YafN of YafNO toxin-antitoxin module